MSKLWTLEEDQKLIELRSQGLIIKEIALLLNRSETAVKLRCSKHIKSGLINKLVWTNKEDDTLCFMRAEGFSAAQIALKLGRTEAAVSVRASMLVRSGLTETKANKFNKWSTEELLEYLREYRTSKALKEAKDCGLDVPSYDIFVNRFKTWHNATQLAGLENVRLDPNSETTLYLVYFIEENFYKIGITQNSINIRLKGYPKYTIIDSIKYTTRKEAKDIEKLLLKITEKYWYIPIQFPYSGYTECFQPSFEVKSIQTLFSC